MPSPTESPKRKRKPIVITDRDRALLRLIADYGVLSTEQVFRLSFPSIYRARKRLQQLASHRFVKRHVRPVRMGEGSAAFLYTVSSKGRNLVQSERALTSAAAQNARVSMCDHTLRINDFRIALSLACRRQEFTSLKTWSQGRPLHFSARVQVGPENKTIPVVPDAFFTIRSGTQDFSYFLEIDRGTTDLRRIRQKLLAYFELWQMRVAANALGIRSFRILYVTTTEKRLLHMLQTLHGLAAPQRRLDLIHFTCFDRYSLEHPENLFQPVWNSIDQTGDTRTICPFPAIPSTLPIAPGKPPVGEPNAGAR